MATKKKGTQLQSHFVVLIILVLISGTLLALSTGGFIVNFKQFGFSVFSAAQNGVHNVFNGIKNSVTAVKELRKLKEEYESFNEKLKDYEYLQRNNAEIRKENERLREQLGFANELQQKNYPAFVIGRDSNNLYSAITISKGAKHGIKKNMPVIAMQNGNIGLVGKVINVGLTTSMIIPIYDYQCNVSGRIQKTRDIGIITGQGNPDKPLLMQYIKSKVKSELSYGDIIVTSGENDNYIRDIPLGTITKFNDLEYDSSLEIELAPVIDFARLETVIVVDNLSQNEVGE